MQGKLYGRATPNLQDTFLFFLLVIKLTFKTLENERT